jgi:hypothetical protein
MGDGSGKMEEVELEVIVENNQFIIFQIPNPNSQLPTPNFPLPTSYKKYRI